MPWVEPHTWITEGVTIGLLNTYLRDELRSLWNYARKGDIMIAKSDIEALRLGIELASNGNVLVADSSLMLGMNWGGVHAAGITNGVVDDSKIGNKILTCPHYQGSASINTWGLNGTTNWSPTDSIRLQGGVATWSGPSTTSGIAYSGSLVDSPTCQSSLIFTRALTSNEIFTQASFSGSILTINWQSIAGYYTWLYINWLIAYQEA